MLGWDFSPRLSGGVGSACRGLAEALVRAGTEVLFVMPRLRGDEDPERVRLVSSEEAARRGPILPRDDTPVRARPAVPEEELRFTNAELPARASPSLVAEELPPALPAPSESLRLLALDSPLQPYLGGPQYATHIRGLLARIRGPTAGRVASAGRPNAPLTARARGGAGSALARTSTRKRAQAAVQRRISYGTTRGAEVERYARTVLAAVAGESFDVVHANDWMTFPAGLLVQEQHEKPLLVHFHSCEAERRGADGARDVHAIEQAALDSAERILCVSHGSARALQRHYALESAKVRVLHNAFSPPDAPGGSLRPRAHGHDPVVLYLGRLAQQKGPDVFLEAAARVHARLPRCRFVLGGEGELYPELVARARELGLTRAVRFSGFLDGEALVEAYRGADVYVMPSAAEPFGISALEALSLGVPTIVARGSGVTEVVRSVLRFDRADAAGLAEKIVALLERPALRSALVATGLREVKNLRWDRPARALRAVYDEVST